MKTNENEIDDILTRAVGNFTDPDGTFKEKLLGKVRGTYTKDIIIKLGADPNRPDIHLGHAVILRKLRALQDIGCKIVFIVGDYTARIGDPTGKNKARPEIEQAEVDANAATYVAQVAKILRTDPLHFSWIRNSDWFTNITDLNLPDDYKVSMDVTDKGKTTKVPLAPNSFVGKAIVFEQSRMQVRDLKLKDKISVITLTGFLWALKHLTHARLIERDMFQDRLKSGGELYMHEMMYPVLQGIDSVVLNHIYGACDLEVGGTDQTFNMLMGRDMMKLHHQAPQAVLSFELLEGLDGKEKMSKSLDNYIGITDVPADMYGKVMSIPDACIVRYFELATPLPLSEIAIISESLLHASVNPRDIKMKLARIIVAIYHGEAAAVAAEEDFVTKFQKKEIPENMAEYTVAEGIMLSDFLLEKKLVESKSDFSRLVDQGAIKILQDEGEKEKSITDLKTKIEKPVVIRIGKHRFVKIILE